MPDVTYTGGIAQVPQTQQGGTTVVSMTQMGGLRVSLTEPDGVDLTRNGVRFAIGRTAGVTGIAPSQTQQTTTAQWALFNTSTSRTMFFDMLGVMLDSGVGGATGISVHCAYFTTPAQTGFATGLAAQCLSNSTTLTSGMAIKSNITITAPAAPAWFPVAKEPSAVTPGILGTTVANWEIRGRIALPPSTGLGIIVYGATGTTPLFGPVAQWVEVASNLV